MKSVKPRKTIVVRMNALRIVSESYIGIAQPIVIASKTVNSVRKMTFRGDEVAFQNVAIIETTVEEAGK